MAPRTLLPPGRGRTVSAVGAMLAMLVVWACNDTPTAPGTDLGAEVEVDLPDSAQQAPGGPGIYSDRTRVFDPGIYQLVSSEAELEAGVYRYRSQNGAPLPEVARDDFLVGRADGSDAAFVRLALRSRMEGSELVVETGGARWNDVVQTGTYGVTIPLGEGSARTFDGSPLQPVEIGFEPIVVGPVTGLGFGPLEAPIPDLDICQILTDAVGLVLSDPQVCGKPRDIDIAVGVVGLKLAGTIDSLLILDGKVGVEGDMDIAINVTSGGISGGRAPVFSPCNQRAYLGCIRTPTGANLIDFLQEFAPQIPDLSLPAIRVCIPGAPVRIKAGWWDWSGILPTWHRPQFTKCAITDVGELPEVVLPTVASSDNTIRPHLKGEALIRVKGDGEIQVKVPLPYLGATAGYGGGHLAAKASVGVFIKLKISVKNGGGTFKVTFDEKGEITQIWEPNNGWDGGYEKIDRSVSGQLVYFDNPDSMVVRLGPILTVGAELCAAVTSCDSGTFFETPAGFYVEPGVTLPAASSATAATAPPAAADSSGGFDLDIGVSAGAEYFNGVEVTWTRSQIDPDDPEIDNHHYDVDWVADLGLNAGITLSLFDKNLLGDKLSWDHTVDITRFPIMDLWGTGTLRVVTNTTGAAPDADGYDVVVSRYDTLPAIIDPGATRLGPAFDHGITRTKAVGVADSIEFSQPGPCAVFYSDILLYSVGGVPLQALRQHTALGDVIPTHAIAYPCLFLIARYNVELTGVAANCTVVDGAQKDDVWLLQINHSLDRPDDLQRVEFTVDCPDGGPMMGDVEVTTVTTGKPPDEGYRVTIDGGGGPVVGTAETLTLTGLSAGSHDVGLTDVPAECTAPATVTVDVDPAVLATAMLTVTCPAAGSDPGDVTVNATTSGPGEDVGGYEVRVDGVARAPLPQNGSAYLENFPASLPTIVHVAELSANCRAAAENPTVVTLDASATPITLPFLAECTTATIDTIDGIVEAAGWPTPTVSVRVADATTVDLHGLVLEEIAQLSGTGVRVWGELRGTTLEVYGYDLDSSLRDPTWVGILADRGGDYWLFGEGATPLAEVSPSLATRVGDLVWVTGAETAAGVQPFIYGVLREN